MDFTEIPQGTLTRGVIGGLLVAMGFFVFVCLMRALAYIRVYGIWSYLKGAFRIQNDSLGLFLVLLMLLFVVLLFFRAEASVDPGLPPALPRGAPAVRPEPPEGRPLARPRRVPELGTAVVQDPEASSTASRNGMPKSGLSGLAPRTHR